MNRKSTLPLHASATELARGVHHPTLAEIQADPVSVLAENHWSTKDSGPMWDPAIVEQIYNDELVKTSFNVRKVMLLEFSQYLEKVHLLVT